MSTTVELRKDANELKKLCDLAVRQRVKDILMIDLRRLETEIVAKEEQEATYPATTTTKLATVTVVPSKSHVRTVDIKTYAWDQSEKFMKIYATVNGVQNVTKDNVTCEFTEKGFQLRCTGVSNTNYRCSVLNLSEKIIPSESYTKIKTDTILVMLKKKETGKTWPYVTEVEKKSKEKTKKPEMDDSKDPQEGLMTMMKQMYDDGDDEMKRTISKAWTESRDKKGPGGDMMM